MDDTYNVVSSPALADGTLYVGSSDSRVYAIPDEGDGENRDGANATTSSDGRAADGGEGDGPNAPTAGDEPGFGLIAGAAGVGLGAWHRLRRRRRDDD